MKKKPTIDQEDLEAFHAAMKGAKPIKHNKIRLIPPSPPAKRARRAKVVTSSLGLHELADVPAVGSEEHVAFYQPGISHKTLRNLRKGQYNVDAVLDLHGMTVNEAKLAVDKFLQQCIHDALRVVLIIHGKGRGSQPILKNKLNQWLRGLTAVLAFSSASAAHGSRGAMYVLLRMQQEK